MTCKLASLVFASLLLMTAAAVSDGEVPPALRQIG